MSFRTTSYQVTVLLASPQSRPLWEWTTWSKLIEPLTPLLTSSRGRTSIRMHQEASNIGSTPNQCYVRFGPLSWNERSHQKWTHGSPMTEAHSDVWSFLSASVWAPGPGTCDKEDMPPDGFLAFSNECREGMDPRQCRFSYSALVAARLDLTDELARAETAIAALREVMEPVLVATTERSWNGGKCQRTGQISGSLTDALILGPFRSGPRHQEAPSPEMLIGRWSLA